MYSYEDRMRAVLLYIKYGKRTAPVIRELGYPSRKNLPRWYRAYVQMGDLPRRSRPKPRYTPEQKEAAVRHYVEHGSSLARCCKALGYPSRDVLAAWINELRPGLRCVVANMNLSGPFAPEQKLQAVSDLSKRKGSARETAQRVGVSRPMLYKWKDQILGKKAYLSMRKRNSVGFEDDRAALLEKIAELEQQLHRQQLEQDILRRTNEVIKKGLGIDSVTLTNREKTQVVDALRDIYLLPELLATLALARSSYFYHRPRVGSVANACTEDKTPERTKKVPSKLSENAAIASNTVQFLKLPRFSVTASEWISAVPTNQGMKDAFSTGSQNHQPPQPSS